MHNSGETNPFAGAGGDLRGCVGSLCEVLEALLPRKPGVVRKLDAMSLPTEGRSVVFSTDPPYYDNIGYADLSDFFYVWLRRSLAAMRLGHAIAGPAHLVAVTRGKRYELALLRNENFTRSSYNADVSDQLKFMLQTPLLKRQLPPDSLPSTCADEMPPE